MEVWVTWLMFRTSEYARLIDAKIQLLIYNYLYVGLFLSLRLANL